jgi:Short C-terminal domain
VEIFIVWLVLAAGVGFLADSRGRSGFGFFLLSALLSPLLGLIVVLVIANQKELEARDRQRVFGEESKERLRREEHERQLESIKAIAAPQKLQTAQRSMPDSSVSVADEIRKLSTLRDEGLLTDAEFHAQKSLLLGVPAKDSNSQVDTVKLQPGPPIVKNGICPNCNSTIPVSSVKCSSCSATFGVGSSWQIRPI